MKAIIILILGFLVIARSEGHAATYWVTPEGSASSCFSSEVDPGRESSQPTINSGVGCLGSGDTLIVKGGIYAEGVFGIPSGRGGSWADAVLTRVRANPGDRVVIQPPAGDPYNPIFIEDGKRFINVDGFLLDASNLPWSALQIGVGGAQAEFIRIVNSELTNGVHGIFVQTKFSEFLNNSIHDNGDSGFDHGIYLIGNSNTVEGNEIYNNVGGGIISVLDCSATFDHGNTLIRYKL